MTTNYDRSTPAYRSARLIGMGYTELHAHQVDGRSYRLFRRELPGGFMSFVWVPQVGSTATYVGPTASIADAVSFNWLDVKELRRS